jgi:8-oxo-dGTP diphosphatase
MNSVGSSVNLHIVKDGQLLLLRRISSKWMDGKLQIPGGHVEAGESPLAAVLREATEELGIAIKPEDVEYLATVAVKDGSNEYFAIQFKLINPEAYEYTVMEPQKCSELVWADVNDLPDDTIELFKEVTKHLRAGHRYLEIGYC